MNEQSSSRWHEPTLTLREDGVIHAFFQPREPETLEVGLLVKEVERALEVRGIALVHARGSARTTVTSADLRGIALQELLAMTHAAMRRGGDSRLWAADASALDQVRAAFDSTPAPTGRQGSRVPDGVLIRVALEYLSLVGAGAGAVHERIATTETQLQGRDVGPADVRSLIRRARDRGYLGQGSQGRLSAVPGPRLAAAIGEEAAAAIGLVETSFAEAVRRHLTGEPPAAEPDAVPELFANAYSTHRKSRTEEAPR
jgi:hypothetical protein